MKSGRFCFPLPSGTVCLVFYMILQQMRPVDCYERSGCYCIGIIGIVCVFGYLDIYLQAVGSKYGIFMDPMVYDDMICGCGVQTAEGVERLPENDLVEIG